MSDENHKPQIAAPGAGLVSGFGINANVIDLGTPGAPESFEFHLFERGKLTSLGGGVLPRGTIIMLIGPEDAPAIRAQIKRATPAANVPRIQRRE